jgi:hypothetical protein
MTLELPVFEIFLAAENSILREIVNFETFSDRVGRPKNESCVGYQKMRHKKYKDQLLRAGPHILSLELPLEGKQASGFTNRS